MMQIRYPNITGRTPEERQVQMERFIRSMVDQLNMQKTSSEPVQKQENTAPATQPKIDFSKLFASHIADYWKTIYPVGSIYLSVSATNPETLFGGKWEQIKDRFLLAAGSSYAAGSTGGEATHALTVSEMPSHGHTFKLISNSYSFFNADSNGSAWNGDNQFALAAKRKISGTSGVDNVLNTSNLVTKEPLNNTGGGNAHNNMPPYLAVYVWKRIK